jgi:hypothetical protein
MAALATALRRRVVYVELPGDDEVGDGLRRPRIRLAARGRHPIPLGALFTRAATETPEGRGFFVGSSPRLVDDRADVNLLTPGPGFGKVDPALGTVLIDYETYRPGDARFLDALASLEGLVPEEQSSANLFARSWDGRVCAAYVLGEVFLDESTVEQLKAAHSSHLAVPGNRLRIYYHRGFEDTVSQGDPSVELRRIPFSLQIAGGAL